MSVKSFILGMKLKPHISRHYDRWWATWGADSTCGPEGSFEDACYFAKWMWEKQKSPEA